MRPGEHALLPLALASVILALDASWAWAGFYHGFQRHSNVVAAVAIVSGVAFMLALVLQAAFPRATGFLRFTLAVLILYWAYTVVLPHLTHDPVESWIKVPGAMAILLTALWSVRSIRDEAWHRICKSVVVASIIFAGSFPIVGHATSKPGQQVFSRQFLKQAPSAPANIVIILFDETSPELAGPIVTALEDNGLVLQVSSIRAAGRHTINVIPAMLSGDRFDGAMPCGSTLLCSDRWTLDFSRLHAQPERATDVIAFFHPYCAIGGLRSCNVIAWSRVDRLASSLKEVTCDHLLAEIDCANEFSPLQEALRRRGGFPDALVPRKPPQREWLSAFRDQLDAAPFWREGGTLYLHVPLPHLPAEVSTGNLAVDYRANIQEAARIAGDIAVRLRSRFGREFLLVITSDHPLRLQLACQRAEYRGPSCRDNLPDSHGMVPLIVASPEAIEPVRMTTNAGLLM